MHKRGKIKVMSRSLILTLPGIILLPQDSWSLPFFVSDSFIPILSRPSGPGIHAVYSVEVCAPLELAWAVSPFLWACVGNGSTMICFQSSAKLEDSKSSSRRQQIGREWKDQHFFGRGSF